MATTTKVFKSGGSHAVRVPRAFRLETDTVTLDRTPGGLLIAEVTKTAAGTQSKDKVSRHRPREAGFLKGLKVPADFDSPLPASALADFGKS